MSMSVDVRGRGPAVVLLHGLGADRRQWARAAEGLDRHRIVTLDFPGHGRSPLDVDRPVTAQVGFQAYAESVVQALDRAGVRSATLAGISMGAAVAMRVALIAPELVQRLVLVRPAWAAAPARPHLGIVADIGRWLADAGAGPTADRVRGDSRFVAIRREVPAAADGLLELVHRSARWPGVLPAMVDDQPVAVPADLLRCRQPALVMACDHDPLHPTAIAATLVAALPRARAVTLPPRYLLPDDHARALLTTMAAFLGPAAP